MDLIDVAVVTFNVVLFRFNYALVGIGFFVGLLVCLFTPVNAVNAFELL